MTSSKEQNIILTKKCFVSRSNSNSIDSEGGRRRSLRKREGKSYAEFGDADYVFEDESSVPGLPLKAHPRFNAPKMNSETAPVSNGDVEMPSEDDDEDEDEDWDGYEEP